MKHEILQYAGALVLCMALGVAIVGRQPAVTLTVLVMLVAWTVWWFRSAAARVAESDRR